MRIKEDRTKKDLIEAIKQKKHRLEISKQICENDRRVVDKKIEEYRAKKADQEAKVQAMRERKEELIRKLRERKEFYQGIKEQTEVQKQLLNEKKAEEETKNQ